MLRDCVRQSHSILVARLDGRSRGRCKAIEYASADHMMVPHNMQATAATKSPEQDASRHPRADVPTYLPSTSRIKNSVPNGSPAPNWT